jgi:riboflavin synthase
MTKQAAIIIKDPQQQYEGLRTSIGLLMEEVHVNMFVLHYEIDNMDEAFRDNMSLMDEMGGKRFSNHAENAEKYGFRYVTMAQVAEKIQQAEFIIPF